MSILIAASFVAMAMPGVQCWPNMANVAALYTDKKMLRDFNEFKKEGPIKKLVIGFKNYYFVNRLEFKLIGTGLVNVLGEYHSRDINRIIFKDVNSTHFECSLKEGVCLFETLHFVSEDPFNMADLMLHGYEAKLHKYVGCFNTKTFKELTSEYVDCEFDCPDTPFYGFTSAEECACIERLPKTETKLHSCQECPKKKAIFCGTEGSVSIYSKHSMHKRFEMDPILYETCLINESVSCPNCIEGRSGFMCMAINCPDVNCGSKSCEAILHVKLDIGFCLCLGGFYIDDALECQDIDECIEDEICKHRNRTCLNTFGNFICKCGAGLYEVDVVHCADIDECQNETICDRSTTTCKNLYRDFECACLEGYIKVDPMIRDGSCVEQKLTVQGMVLALFILLLLVAVIISIWFRRKKIPE